MIKKTLLLLSCMICACSFAQKQANFWYFGTLAGIDFNSGAPVPLANGALNTTEGSAAISDAAGNLLFYTDGQTVWNKNNVQMPNGFGLLGDPSTTQSALIVPNPGNANLYYIFTLPAEGSGNFNYSVVDMSLQAGNGDVTVKNTFLRSNVTEKLTAVYHCNGHDVWVGVHDLGTDVFATFLVTNTGVGPAVISHAGSLQTRVHGQMKFNTSGTAIACALDSVISSTPLPGTGKAIVDVCKFNNVTGVVTSDIRINIPHQKAYGVEFSPNGTKLYVSYYNVANDSYVSQYDLMAANVQASGVVMNMVFNPEIYGLQLGPDYKVYITHSGSPFLDVVNAPNNPAATASYSINAVNLDPSFMGSMCLLGLPGFIQSYFNPAFPNVPCTQSVTAAFINSDTTICPGTCITFTNQSTGTPTSWNWTFQGGTPSSSTAQNPPTICYPASGTYTVRLIVSNGSSSDTVTKSIIVTSPGLTASGSATITAGGNTPLNASGSVTGYTWTPAAGLSNPMIANPIASPTVTTTYTVRGTDSNGCSASGTVTVVVVPVTVTAGFISSDTTICPGTCITFTNQSTGTPTSWNWTFQGGTPSSSTAQNPPTICYPASGTYTVRLIVSNGSSSDTMIRSIIVTSPTLTASGSATVTAGGSTSLNASGSVTGYTWTPAAGLSDPMISSPVANPGVTTTYTVRGTDSNGCSASGSVTVVVVPATNTTTPTTTVTICGEVFVPTGFSPNDDGMNDLECIAGDCITRMEFSIYDRWGEKVFESTDQALCWNGFYKGKALDNGIFVYYLKATLSDGSEINKKGNISLIR